MIVCLSPNSIYLEETLSSISYAEKAKKIKPAVQRQQVASSPEEAFKRRIVELEKENSNLRKQLLERGNDRSMPQSPPLSATGKPFSVQVHPSLAIMREKVELVATVAADLARAEIRAKSIRDQILENRQAMDDLQQVIAAEKNDQQIAALYKELRKVTDCLEEDLQVQEKSAVEEKQLREVLRSTKIKVLDMFQEVIQTCEKLESHGGQTTVSQGNKKPIEPKTPGKSWKGVHEIEDGYSDIAWIKEELLRKEEQINELTKALKNLARIPSSPQLGGLSRLGLDNMLADISSIRYDPKLVLFTSDCMETEKKASNTNARPKKIQLPDLIAKLSQVLDPTTKNSDGNQKQQGDNHGRDSVLVPTKSRLERTLSQPGLVNQTVSDDSAAGASANGLSRGAGSDDIYFYTESDMDDYDSHINPLSLADENWT